MIWIGRPAGESSSRVTGTRPSATVGWVVMPNSSWTRTAVRGRSPRIIDRRSAPGGQVQCGRQETVELNPPPAERGPDSQRRVDPSQIGTPTGPGQTGCQPFIGARQPGRRRTRRASPLPAAGGPTPHGPARTAREGVQLRPDRPVCTAWDTRAAVVSGPAGAGPRMVSRTRASRVLSVTALRSSSCSSHSRRTAVRTVLAPIRSTSARSSAAARRIRPSARPVPPAAFDLGGDQPACRGQRIVVGQDGAAAVAETVAAAAARLSRCDRGRPRPAAGPGLDRHRPEPSPQPGPGSARTGCDRSNASKQIVGPPAHRCHRAYDRPRVARRRASLSTTARRVAISAVVGYPYPGRRRTSRSDSSAASSPAVRRSVTGAPSSIRARRG